MTEETGLGSLPYDRWIEDALRGVVTRALNYAAEEGLPDEHHYYITFRTDAEDVEIPSYLRALHRDEMTIVLQHQFWDLSVEEDSFAVTLKFRGKRERLFIPLAAVTQFADPSVNFGLQLKTPGSADDESADDEAAAQSGGELMPFERGTPEDGEPEGEGGNGRVIALDSFRKK